MLFFFDHLCCLGFHGQISKTVCCSKSLQKQATLRILQQNGWYSGTSLWSPWTNNDICVLVILSCRGIRYCKWNPQIINGIRIKFRKPLTFAESGTTTHNCSLRNPQQNVWNLEQICGIHEQIIIVYLFSKLKMSRIPQLYMECTNCTRNPQIVSGIRINLRSPTTFAELTYICGIRNNYLCSLVVESATKSTSRQSLRYSYLYAESTKLL